MSLLSKPLPAVNTHVDTSGERDLVMSALRVAAARSRLETNLFDSIGTALRHKSIDCTGALTWLKEEGLLDRLPFGQEVKR